MKTKALSRSAAPIALAATLLAAFLVLLSPLSASAHDALVSSSPAADESVEVVPAALTLTFNAKLIGGEGATEVVVTDPSGASITDGPATVDGAIVTQPLTGSGPAGAYHVIWKVVSSDGHPTSGEYSFTVTVGDESAATTEPSVAPTTTPPTAEQTAAPAPTATTVTESGDSADGSAWIWVVVIVAVLVVAGVVVWIVMSRRGGGPRTDSDPSSER
ncbi:copper resistance CopC family protein [Microbacterium sp.]|uniref:copper resistance CopC family protein n=1 Tax=unclassified Microbacterium TaxID=2609290 RepID=UPI002639B0AC|nr:copper resistance CopC family protein [Microbacterium sp.]MCV0335238.1 copper resistance protein CopC [Microbacterium sp.]MCV0375341.1 copper resistance protein CopC [Microbacterium sp.]MCV0388140.1 copper resistance protein CopC [Microbacterium sp.]MCV0416667.1 copper resistance protein CopC [Microbacterium sp.]MCV0423280.1 copper resistance protein CopC [Microbacterium sp.]